MISTVSSVEPPSIMMYSRLGYPCSSTLLIVASMYRPWLNEGVTTDIFGQSPLLPFMLRPSSHLRSHDIPQTSRRARSRRRGVPQRAHPNIPLTTTHAATLLSAKSRATVESVALSAPRFYLLSP
jgi:hypothetical protein